ncbi:MAG TPA: TPM domain-containing protein [Limnobacter sp.]|nr:TPM domain-containing protein [Limnobacter sp.]
MGIQIKRLVTHLCTTERAVHKAFGTPCLQAVEQTIQASEQHHTGEIRFAVESALALPDLLANRSARERAVDVFSNLRVWDTEHNNGVLIYVLLADHAIEIVADRGIHRAVGDAAWDAVCTQVKEAFGRQDYLQGSTRAIEAVSALLMAHFPCKQLGGPNELPNRPVVLG